MSAKNPDLAQYLNLIPSLKKASLKMIWMSYDEEADTLYVNFKKPSKADDSELTDNDLIVRYEDNEVIGFTVLNASTREVLDNK